MGVAKSTRAETSPWGDASNLPGANMGRVYVLKKPTHELRNMMGTVCRHTPSLLRAQSLERLNNDWLATLLRHEDSVGLRNTRACDLPRVLRLYSVNSEPADFVGPPEGNILGSRFEGGN